jgi:hypothetical protein
MKITTIEDPAVTELQRIVTEDLSVECSFMYANFFEANFGLDSLAMNQQFPVFLFIANDKSVNRIIQSGLILRDVSVVGMFLNAMPHDETIEFKSQDVSPYINDMRQLADNFIYNINKSSLTYEPNSITSYTIDKVYAKFDAHLFGVGISFNWTINTGIRGC